MEEMGRENKKGRIKMWGENGKKEEPCVRVSEKIEMEGNEVWHR